MHLLFTFMVSLSLTVLLMPPLIRLAPRVGLVDLPDPRKVHRQVTPRCGGIGLAIGAMVPLLAWGNPDQFLTSYLVGALIILIFGVWDDIVTLSYRWKFLGQFLAVFVVMSSGVILEHLPFFGVDPAPVWLSHGVTFLLLLGVTNAVNLFDGLDGLAGGCGVMSLIALFVLGLADPQGIVPMVAIAMVGGILGFLRYNAWPAMVFMGDAGSQLLGFTAAVLSIRLVEHANMVLTPAIVVLLLGLPIMDTLMVMGQRLSEGRSPFSPDKNHTHHKFLALGFHHYEAVSAIYLIQALLVTSAFVLRYEHDLLVLGTYVTICVLVIQGLFLAKAKGWRLRSPSDGPVERRNMFLRRLEWLPQTCVFHTMAALTLFLTAGPLLAPQDMSSFAPFILAVAALAAIAQFFPPAIRTIVIRCAAYLALALSAYGVNGFAQGRPLVSTFVWGHVALVVPVLVLGIRVTRRDLFRVSPQDLLVALIVGIVPYLPADLVAHHDLGQLAVTIALYFYVIEFLLQRDEAGCQRVGIPAGAALFLHGIRGMFGI